MARNVEMDMMAELASAIVERQWHKKHTTDHSVTTKDGDIHYIPSVEKEFCEVLDVIDNVLNE